MSIRQRLKKLEEALPGPAREVCVYLNVPGGKGDWQQLADGRLLPCPDVRAVLPANRVCKVYMHFDPDWV